MRQAANEGNDNSSTGGHTRGLHRSLRQRKNASEKGDAGEGRAENKGCGGIKAHDVHGLILFEDEDDEFVGIAVHEDAACVCIGDRVVSNGRFGAHDGTPGTVVAIDKPYTKSRTSNVVHVEWDGVGKTPKAMKLKDLRWSEEEGFVSP
jgi:hypothetical protein